MKSLHAFCTRQRRLCIATGILVASLALIAIKSQAEEVFRPPAPAVEESTQPQEPRRLVRTRKKSKSISLTEFVKNAFKRTKRQSSARSTTTAQPIIKQAAGQQKRTVEEELKALYEKNGRRMPSMKLQDAPNTQTASKPNVVKQNKQRPTKTAPVVKPVARTAPRQYQVPTRQQKYQAHQQQIKRQQQQQQQYQAQQRTYRKKPTLLQRLFGRKGSRQTYRQPQPPQYVQQQQQKSIPSISSTPSSAPAPAPAPVAVAQSKPVAAPTATVARSYPVPPAPAPYIAPAAEVKTAAKVEPQTATQPKLVSNETPVTEPKKPVNNIDNPFPELSENEADGTKEEVKKEVAQESPSPFTGITLNDKPEEKEEKIETIPGLKGFCIVTLRNDRQLVDAKDDISSTYQGKKFTFASKEAKEKFDSEPDKYAPVKSGKDVVTLASGEQATTGSLNHAVWYKSKLYLFTSQNNLQIFVQNPSKYKQTDDK